jgi:tRNA-dihydrouridine synthase B
MAGVSDLPFRLITRSFGCPLAFTEMIDATAIGRNDKRTRHMLASSPTDRPLGVQLLGNDPDHMLRALDALVEYEFDLLDLNAACPTPKVTRKGKGAALLKEPRKLKEILKALVDHTSVPVTVKIRAGWDVDSVNAREVALCAEDAGIDGLFIHGRTRAQGYGGQVDYGVIAEVKAALSIPVIASGDNISVFLVRTMFEETGCDGVAIARGALGYPWIFREVAALFGHDEAPGPPALEERMEVMKRHLGLMVDHWGDRRAAAAFHKFFIWYTRGLHGMKELRDKAFRTESAEELSQVIEEVQSSIKGAQLARGNLLSPAAGGHDGRGILLKDFYGG